MLKKRRLKSKDIRHVKDRDADQYVTNPFSGDNSVVEV